MRFGLVGLALGYAAPAVAGTCSVPGDYVSLTDAVKSSCLEIEVDAAWYLPKVDFPGVEIGHDLVIVGVNGTPSLPHLGIYGANVTIDNVVFGTIVDVDPYDALEPAASAVTVVGGSLRLSNSELATLNKAGLQAFGSQITLEEVRAIGFLYERVVTIGAGYAGEPSSLDIIGGEYTANAAGVISAWDTAVTVAGTMFSDNMAESGVVLEMIGNDRGSLSLTDVVIQRSWSWGDETVYGGSVVVIDTDVVMTRGELRDLDSSGLGAGITLVAYDTYADDPMTFVATDVVWTGNHADHGGSGLFAVHYDVRIEGASRFEYSSGGIAAGAGGAVSLSGGAATFQGTKFTGNGAYAGGAVAVGDGAATFVDAELDGGGAQGAEYGGFVYAYNGEVSFLGTRLASVSAAGLGGAVYADGESSVLVDGGEISGVDATLGGGFAFVTTGSFEARNLHSQVTGAGAGGFLYAIDADVVVQDAVFGDSTAYEGGGTLHLEDARSALVARSMFCSGSAWAGAALELAGRPTRGSAVIENNVFAYNAGAASFKMFPGYLGGAGRVELRNNDFVNNATSADVRLYESGADLRNLLFLNSTVAVDAQAATTGGYNLYDGVGSEVQGGGFVDATAVRGRALFVDGPPDGCEANLYPTEDSPVVEAGDPAMPAPWGERIDIGVYEWIGEDPIDDTDVEDTDVDEERPVRPSWVSGGGGCATTGGSGIGWLASGLGLLALRGRRSAVRSARFG